MVTKNVNPEKDTGWGVIYRLNELFREVEIFATSGAYDKWNYKLDRIWSNLLYRTPFVIAKDGEKIISIDFNEEAYNTKMYFDKQIVEAKKEMREVRTHISEEKEYNKNKNYIQAKNKLYKVVTMKDIWLRKYMYELGLYLKEIEHNPAGSMWGK